jgi:hypothetical protein
VYKAKFCFPNTTIPTPALKSQNPDYQFAFVLLLLAGFGAEAASGRIFEKSAIRLAAALAVNETNYTYQIESAPRSHFFLIVHDLILS